MTDTNNTAKKYSMVLRLFFLVSMTAMTMLLSPSGNIVHLAAGVMCSFIVSSLLIFKYKLPEKIFEGFDRRKGLFVSVPAVFADICFVQSFIPRLERKFISLFSTLGISESNAAILTLIVNILLGVMAFAAVFAFLYAFFGRFSKHFNDFISQTDRTEKYYIIICTFILSVAVIIIFSLTNAFYLPSTGSDAINYDVVYTTDSGSQLKQNVYVNISSSENDLRQPLFGLFAMPFSVMAYAVSTVFFFIPNIYPILINITQIILLLAGFVLISRMMRLKGSSKAFFLTASTFLYPTLLFSLNMEQYIFTVFWLILFIYTHINNKEDSDYCFIASAGSILTSGIFFPLISQEKKFSLWIKDIYRAAVKFLTLIIVFGRLPLFLSAVSSLKSLMRFTGVGLTFSDKLLHFVNFVASCIVKPQTVIDTKTFEHISYQLSLPAGLNYLGLIALLAAVLGFILNYKNKFAKISFAWVVFSFIILCVVGWGTKENGLILYSLYFSWAYISLIFMFFEKIFSRVKPLKTAVYTAGILALIMINLPGIYDVIRFGLEFYPVR